MADLTNTTPVASIKAPRCLIARLAALAWHALSTVGTYFAVAWTIVLAARWTLGALGVVVLIALVTVTPSRAATSLTATDFWHQCTGSADQKPICLNFLAGAADALYAAGYICPTPSDDTKMLAALWILWYMRHPADHADALGGAVVRMLRDAYPCQSAVATPPATLGTKDPRWDPVPGAKPIAVNRVMDSQAEPQPDRTPGAINPAVMQANIHSTICVPGWTRTVRPPESYTEKLKRNQIEEFGYVDGRLSDYEEDHLIPLELGGAPTDPRNLWPEPRRPFGAMGSADKDRLENELHWLVCHGRLPLATAQRAIETDWEAAYSQYLH